jgi:hypothetical protein
MELTERITSRVTELTGEVELLRKQLADAGHELERLETNAPPLRPPECRTSGLSTLTRINSACPFGYRRDTGGSD